MLLLGYVRLTVKVSLLKGRLSVMFAEISIVVPTVNSELRAGTKPVTLGGESNLNHSKKKPSVVVVCNFNPSRGKSPMEKKVPLPIQRIAVRLFNRSAAKIIISPETGCLLN